MVSGVSARLPRGTPIACLRPSGNLERRIMGPYRMLVVDDEEPILFAMREYFRAYGYRVDCARELEEAEALVSRHRYDLVVADLRLSDVHGSEGLALIGHVRECSPDTQFILLTAYGSPDLEREARRMGAARVLHKPKPLPEVAQIVFSLLKMAES
jgi:two-component system OmpR family response regulator